MALRAALKAVSQRQPREMPAKLGTRRVLVVLPPGEEAMRSAWRFLRRLTIGRDHLTPVVLAEGVAYVPDAWVGAVIAIGEKERDWRGLPRPAVAQALWGQRPAVALSLVPAFELGAAYLVGASPAALRIGFHTPEAEPFFDLLFAAPQGLEGGLTALTHYLAALDPPVLPFVEPERR